jgi:ribulose-5-phosphate 4-epimerase/fuculose-1-phosphate aldolase
MKEGVTKFQAVFTRTAPIDPQKIIELNLWRKVLYSLKLIGQDPSKYDGAAYGNLSQRLDYDKTHKRAFIITGTQTGGLETLTHEHYAIVLEHYPEKNLVISEGPIAASSESMSHGTLYDLDSSLRFVFHVHSKEIWQHARQLEIPTTKETVEYGTPVMAEEIRRLFRETNARFKHILAMGGHEDGIIAFGRTSAEAGSTILKYLTQASQLHPV